MNSYRSLALTLVSVLALSSAALAQAPGGNNNGDRRGGNPEEFRKRMEERIKGMLKASDEEWTVLQPLIENVTSKQREAMGNRFGRRGGGDNNNAPDTTRPGVAQSEALRTALESESTSPEEIKSKLAAVREQRKKSTAELVQARAELQKVLTVRQEAALVSVGILE